MMAIPKAARANRPEAIRADLVGAVPAKLSRIGTELTALRAEHVKLWEAHRAAIHANAKFEGPTSAAGRRVLATREAMDAYDPQIGRLRVELQVEREKFEPVFQRKAKAFHAEIADDLEGALGLLSSALSKLNAIDTAAGEIGLSPMARVGQMPSLPMLAALIGDLRK